MTLLAIVGVDPLLLVGAVLFGLLVALSWLGRRAAGRVGREAVMLTNQHAVHVVEIAGRRLLIGTGPSGAPRVLVELGEAAPAPEALPTTVAQRSWAILRERFGGLGGR
jgi:hypothetical protein